MNRLAKIRKELGLSQLKVSNDLSITPATYSRYESGDRNPPNETLAKIAEYFGVTTDYLLGIDDVPKRKTEFHWIKLRDGLPAGPLSEVDNFVIGYVEVPKDRYKNPEELEAVKVKGDSMEPRIMNGDIVIFRPQKTAETGDTVIFRVNGEDHTLKKIKYMTDGILLIPLNQQKYEPMFYSWVEVKKLPVEIIGVVLELRGQL